MLHTHSQTNEPSHTPPHLLHSCSKLAKPSSIFSRSSSDSMADNMLATEKKLPTNVVPTAGCCPAWIFEDFFRMTPRQDRGWSV